MSDNNKPQQALFNAVFKLLRPLVRILLRNGVPYGAFTDLAKRAYVDVAMREFSVPGKKQTKSRVSTITGLSRKEIQRLIAIEEEDDRDMVARYNRAARVVYGWVHNADYANDEGDARILNMDGGEPSFASLVKAYSGDVPPRAILDELTQVGVVKVVDDGQVKLLARAYIPKTGEAEKLKLLGRDVSGLLQTMDKNIHNIGDAPYFQRKVFYDNLPEEAVKELQNILNEKGQDLLEYLDIWMSEHDRDSTENVEGTGRKAAGIGIYYFEEDVSDPSSNDSSES